MPFRDVLSVYAAVVLAYWRRYGLQLGPVHSVVPFSAYQAFAFLLAGIMAFTLLLKGSYRPQLGAEMDTEFAAVVSAATISMTSIMVLTYMLYQFCKAPGIVALPPL